jgi:hypothetical protein
MLIIRTLKKSYLTEKMHANLVLLSYLSLILNSFMSRWTSLYKIHNQDVYLDN